MGTLDQVTAMLHSEIWDQLQKLPEELRSSIELAGLKAMRDHISQRVRCVMEGEGCEVEPTIAGISEDWL